MKHHYDSGQFPSLQQFLIISKRRQSSQVPQTQHGDAKWAVYTRDIVTNTTAGFPRIFLEQHKLPPPGNSFTYSPRALLRVPDQCPFVENKYWGKEYVSGCGAVRRLVEGTSGWEMYYQGPHIPGLCRKEIECALDDGFFSKSPFPDTVEVFWKEGIDVSCELWDEEGKCEQQLLKACVWDGVLHEYLVERMDPVVGSLEE